MTAPVAFGDRGLDADLASIIGGWEAPGPMAARRGADGAGLLPRLIGSQGASTTAVAALAFALIAGTAYVLRDRGPGERPRPVQVARQPATVTNPGAGRQSAAPAVEAAAEAEAVVAPVEAELAATAPPAAEVPDAARPARVAPSRVAARAKRPDRPVAAAPTEVAAGRPVPAAEPTPEPPVQLAMVPPAAEPVRAARVAPARFQPVEREADAGESVPEAPVERRRARKDSIDSMRSLRRQ